MAKYLSNRPMLMREVIVMMAMTDEIMMMLMRDRSNRDDADSMLKREAIIMGIMIAWLHIYHNHVRTFNFVGSLSRILPMILLKRMVASVEMMVKTINKE